MNYDVLFETHEGLSIDMIPMALPCPLCHRTMVPNTVKAKTYRCIHCPGWRGHRSTRRARRHQFARLRKTRSLTALR